MKNQDYLYLDHAASTPMRKSAMDKYIEAESFGCLLYTSDAADDP